MMVAQEAPRQTADWHLAFELYPAVVQTVE